ncbi:site-specific integrase [Streptomyces sp. McG8]|uniref:site-specific integrase n=1 Tax=Streptomyces sp. McG8 TaxID=2725487 RepID=UPI001BEBC501|nr:site-specific integrase [Streptomyces sp. McG8]
MTSSTATTAVSSTRGPTERRPRAWKQAKKPRPPHLRARWKAAQAALKVANAEPRKNSGPGAQKRYLDTVSAALGDAVREKLISENWTDGVAIPKYHRPDPLVWTDERVARWRETGRKPGPVMVGAPEQTGEFLDAAVEHPLYVMWHLMVFCAPRRGEAAGLPWAGVDMTKGRANIVEQLVSDASYDVWEDTPKSRSGRRTVTLDSATFALMTAWRDVQKAQRTEWEGKHCAASLSLAAGLSMKAIQALLGRASYSLTADTYTSLMPQFEKEAADAPVALVPRKGADPATDNSTEAGEPSQAGEPKALYLVQPDASEDGKSCNQDVS